MKRVLLVDDEAGLRRLLKAVLKADGFEVIEASNSADGLALAQGNHVDVLVTDVMLEDVDGLSLAHCVTEKEPSVLVVFISGYPVDIEAEQRRHPYCAFVSKPFQPKTLITTIHELSEKQSREQ